MWIKKQDYYNLKQKADEFKCKFDSTRLELSEYQQLDSNLNIAEIVFKKAGGSMFLDVSCDSVKVNYDSIKTVNGYLCFYIGEEITFSTKEENVLFYTCVLKTTKTN